MRWFTMCPVFAVLLLAPTAGSGGEPGTLTFAEDLVLGLDDAVPLGPSSKAAVDSQGNIYVLDIQFKTVRKFDPEGVYLKDLGREGEAPGEYYNPGALAVGPEDRVYVAGFSSYVTVMEADGTPLDSFKRHATGGVHSMCFDGDGNLYVCAYDRVDRKMVHKYRAGTHEYELSFSDSYGVGKDVPFRIEQVYALGFLDTGEDGTILYAQVAPQLVRVFGTSGNLLATHRVRFDQCPFPEARTNGETTTFRVGTSGSAIVGLEGGYFLTVLSLRADERPWPGVVDVYDADGDLRYTTTRKQGFAVVGKDREGRVFVSEERGDVPVLVRYRIVMNGG